MNLQNFRIGEDATKLLTGQFCFYRIATPDTSVFKGFSEQIPQADGQVQHGSKNVEITWVNPNNNTVYQVKKFVDAALASTKLLYLTVPYNDGTKVGERWIDIYGTPIPVNPEPLPITWFGSGFSTLTLRINDLTILNNPASGV